MFLVESGYFGDPNPDVNSLHKLLVVAYRDFKAFQKERRPGLFPRQVCAELCHYIALNSLPK